MRFFVLLIVLVLQLAAGAQPQLKEVPGLPTKEVFDLLVDRKGFLWVGHDMGISRFDGVSFTHFAHPQRSSLSVTDLVEDRFGRIWFHNFSGQVFYIENDQMHLLEAYKYMEEEFFPRLVLCNDEIVITSAKGLFVCDTRTLRSRYLNVGHKSPTKSLTAIGKKVLALNVDEWYVYEGGSVMKPVFFEQNNGVNTNYRNIVLQPKALGDTAIVLANPSGTVYKVHLENETLKLSDVIQTGNFINNVQVVNNEVLINGKEHTFWFRNGNTQKIFGLNISDVVADRQGNIWFSTLNRGLMVQNDQDGVSPIKFSFLDTSDVVLAMEKIGNNVLIGTKMGRLYEIAPGQNKPVWQYAFQHDVGSIHYISPVMGDKVLISTSSETYQLSVEKKTIKKHFSFTAKQVVTKEGNIYTAMSNALMAFPMEPVAKGNLIDKNVSLEQWNAWWVNSGFGTKDHLTDQYYLYFKRCRSIELIDGKDLYVSFMDGVHRLGAGGPELLQYNGNRVYSNSMVSHRNTLFIGTLNSGLLIKNGTHFKHISTAEGLFSNSIIRMKKAGKYLWIFQDKAIQLMNLETQSLVNGIELPQETGANVHDVASFGDTAILSTNNGLYQVVLKPSDAYKNLKSFLNVILTSSPERHILSGTGFRYNQNDLQFHLSIPFYSPSNSVYFKYRLKGGGDDSQWFSTLQGERIVRFASLMPGDYVFEAYAVVAGQQEGTPVTFSFTINKPWWKTITFMVIVFLLIALATYLLYRYRLRQIMKVERVRSTISGDLHDEIGSTLSSINIYSELAKTEADNKEYLDLIQDNTRDVISKLDDLVWSINPKNDSVAQLVSRMRSFAEPVFKGVNIQCRFNANDELLKQELPLITKRNLYLIFKELVNNVVKHSRAKNCVIDIQFTAGHVHLMVADDGIGINNQKHAEGRSGMQSLVNRTRQLNAAIIFKDNPLGGTIVHLSVPVK